MGQFKRFQILQLNEPVFGVRFATYCLILHKFLSLALLQHKDINPIG